MHRGLFVAHKDVANTLLGMQCIVNGKHGAAWIAENGIDPERGQGVEQCLGTREGSDTCTRFCGR
jgi:hypothetical protein